MKETPRDKLVQVTCSNTLCLVSTTGKWAARTRQITEEGNLALRVCSALEALKLDVPPLVYCHRT